MATNPDDLNDDEHDLDTEETGEDEDEDQQDDDTGDDEEAGGEGDDQVVGNADEDDDDAVISFDGDDGEPLEGNDLVKHLRNQLKEARREAAEAKKSAPVEQAKPELRAKPTLADHAYDEEAFEEDLAKWQTEKREVDELAQTQRKAEEQAQEAWKNRLGEYETGKKALGFADVDEVENIVTATLTPAQQVVIVKVADDPAKMIYALGKSPSKLKELAEEQDMLSLAKKVINLERTTTVSRRNRPAPDKGLRGSAGVESSDKKLERLEKEAEKTGDRTALIAYKRSLGQK